MSSQLLFFSLLVAISHCREIKIYNKCPFPTWPKIQGFGNPQDSGFKLESGQTRTIHVDDSSDGTIRARTECDENMKCATGNGQKVQPATLAKIHLQGIFGYDVYHVSLLDGYNIPVLIDVNGGQGDCKRAGGSVRNINDVCPAELKVEKDGRTIACRSGCSVFKTDKECCRGEFKHDNMCSFTETFALFKQCCSQALTNIDDSSEYYSCRGANYVVQFC